jgi:hypothetical protein
MPFEDYDKASIQLALVYARTIDNDPSTLIDLGPKLQTTLTSLGLNPQGRAAQDRQGKVTNANFDALAKQREQHKRYDRVG